MTRVRVDLTGEPNLPWLREQLGDGLVIRLIGEPVESIEIEADGLSEVDVRALIGQMPLPSRRPANPARAQLHGLAARGWDDLTAAERALVPRLLLEASFGRGD